MNALWTVFRKELLDALRDRRMMMMALVIGPLAGPLILAGISFFGAMKQKEKIESVLELPVIGAQQAPNLMAWLESHSLKIVPPPSDADAAVRDQEHEVVLRVTETFADDWRAGRPAQLELIYDSSRPLQTGTTIARLRGLLDAYDQELGTLRLIARGIHPAVARPLLVGARDVATPQSKFDFAQQLLPYMLLLLGFIGGMQLAIDATAGERERQSLEPLLATPASRAAIISGKILATAAFTLLSLVVTLLAFRLVFGLLPTDKIDMSINLPWTTLAKLLLVILPIVLLGATLLTALAAFAKSHREAQGYLPLLTFLPMIPTLMLMVSPVKTQLWMLAVPFLGQNQLILKVLRGESISLVEWLLNLLSGLLIAGILWLIAARLYHREQLAASS